MAIRQKLLVLWVVLVMALAFLASYAVSFLAASLENAFAFALAAAFVKLAAVASCGWNS